MKFGAGQSQCDRWTVLSQLVLDIPTVCAFVNIAPFVSINIYMWLVSQTFGLEINLVIRLISQATLHTYRQIVYAFLIYIR